MPDWAQIIDDALDILKFDGAVHEILWLSYKLSKCKIKVVE